MNWYCVHTKPLKESQVKSYLERQLGLEVYFPRLRASRRIRRVKRVVVSALFPRYQFCRFDPASHYRAIRFAPEVLDIVSHGPEPQIVDDKIIDGLKSWASDELDIISIQPLLRPGEQVEIVGGPLSGLKAVVLNELPGQHRVAILLEAMGCGARMLIDRSNVDRAS